MFLSAIATGSVILSAGIYMVSTGRKKTKLLQTYEQENRSSDGTVRFKSLEASRTHGANKNLFRVITLMGFFTGLFGLTLIGYGLNIFTYP